MNTSTTSDDSTAPTTEITTRSSTEMVSARPRETDTVLAMTASASAVTNVRMTDAKTFWPTTVSARRDRPKVPVWIAVLSRLPSAPKMLPRMPMDAGTSTSRPGSRSRVPVMAPSAAPAARLVRVLSPRATRVWRAPAASGPSRARKRGSSRRGRRRIGHESARRPRLV